MTLVVTIANEWGVWQCADHRLSVPASGKKHSSSWKSLHVDCTDGGILVGFSGFGAALETPSHHEGLVVDWLRGVVRGETRTVEDALDRIHEQANIVLAPQFRQWSEDDPRLRDLEHTFVFGAFDGKTPRILTTSFTASAGKFVRAEHPIQQGGAYRVIGQADKIGPDDLHTLERICRLPPSSVEDYKHLLAKINSRASLKTKTISEACNSTYLAPEGLSSNSTPYFHEGADLALPVPPMMMIEGVDMTDWFQSAMDEFCAAVEQGISLDDVELSTDDKLLEAGSESDTRLTKPKNKSS